jgi:hypothetical protein
MDFRVVRRECLNIRKATDDIKYIITILYDIFLTLSAVKVIISLESGRQ